VAQRLHPRHRRPTRDHGLGPAPPSGVQTIRRGDAFPASAAEALAVPGDLGARRSPGRNLTAGAVR
jgi:hypothetical protein